MKRILRLLLVLLPCGAAAQPGTLDPTFNPGDAGFATGIGADVQVARSVLQPDGKILIAGYFDRYNGYFTPGLARLNADGTRDTSFHTGSGVDASINALCLQADGKILIGGWFNVYNGTPAHHLARLLASGAIDPSFNTGSGTGGSADGDVIGLAVQSTGNIFVSGNFTTYNGQPATSLIRLLPNGSRDATFAFNGSGGARNFTVLPGDKFYASGSISASSGADQSQAIARFNADGSYDAGFNTYQNIVPQSVAAHAVQPDGKVIIVGIFNTYNGTARRGVARLNADGSLDNTFVIGTGATGSSFVTGVALQPDGKIIVTGSFTGFNGTTANKIVRLGSTGSVDAGFVTGSGAGGPISNLHVLSNGRIIASGNLTSYNGGNRGHVLRILDNGRFDSSFNPQRGANATVKALAVMSDGRIYAGGSFSSFNDTARSYLTRLLANGAVDPGFAPGAGANGDVEALALQSDGKLVAGGSFTTFNGIAAGRIVRLNTDGSTDAGFAGGTGANSAIYAVAVQPDGKILAAGNLRQYNGSAVRHLVRLNVNGSIDGSFNTATGSDTTIYALCLQPDGKILAGGSFGAFNGSSRPGLLRLNADGTPDATFGGSGANGAVYSIRLLQNGRIAIGGSFTQYNGVARKGVAVLNADGSLYTGFDPGAGVDGNVEDLVVLADDQLLIGGSFRLAGGLARRGVARLNTDGSADASFTNGTGADSTVFVMAVQADGKALLGGDFSAYNGTGRNRIARIFATGVLTSVREIGATGPEISAYPNPATGTVILRLGGNKMKEIRIYHASGVLVARIRTAAASAPVSLSGLPPGNYLAEVQCAADGWKRVLKLVKY
ncbi:T9SS type A sorting domain-containing protein [Flaviaesturariibacter flavus]|uniref:T9SS type A sorting domain-containing protein n=1 Tax=Flaviaesturariibacter flavus TaxID=2502780 RepID=A0A4V2NWJ2_9BACT|nr:T9SS type A sorting domain-containing protein [Flaviaesturariibacter flavus]TCJ17582.1 T9SS type A sorting domain-containing protein [Flaviaesturariibacter flavus]